MQVVFIEYVCNVVGMEKVNSIEFDFEIFYLVVGFIIEWLDVVGMIEVCIEILDFGGIMCLGSQFCYFIEGIKVYEMYGNVEIYECYCYCYEVNNNFCD